MLPSCEICDAKALLGWEIATVCKSCASKLKELSTTAPNSASDAIALLREIVDRYGVDESSCWLGGFVKRAAAIVQQRTLP